MLTESDSFVVDVVLLFFSIDFVQREVNIIVSFCVFKTWGGGGWGLTQKAILKTFLGIRFCHFLQNIKSFSCCFDFTILSRGRWHFFSGTIFISGYQICIFVFKQKLVYPNLELFKMPEGFVKCLPMFYGTIRYMCILFSWDLILENRS